MGDRLIAVDGWPCFGHDSKQVTERITGLVGSMVTLSTQKVRAWHHHSSLWAPICGTDIP